MAKTKVKKLNVSAPKKDAAPSWDGHDTWTGDEFNARFRSAMNYYNTNFSGKDLKPAIVKWMSQNDYTKKQVQTFKDTKDWRCTITTGAIASCLLRGMPGLREDFNNGRSTETWLKNEIVKIITEGANDVPPKTKEEKASAPAISIQERVRDASLAMTAEIEDALAEWQADADNFDPKAIKIASILRGREAKAAHARIIKDFYGRQLSELQELASGKSDRQLVEGYQHRSRKQIKKLIDFLTEIDTACTMLQQEAKATKKPRKIKSINKEKVVSKLKYKKTDEPLKLVSVNPIDIIGSKELWVYNTKNRKLGKYVAAEYQELGIKGTSITGFNETLSICKTLRKPAEQLKALASAGKVVLRKFLDEINAVDTKMNGRINEEIVLLKVAQANVLLIVYHCVVLVATYCIIAPTGKL